MATDEHVRAAVAPFAAATWTTLEDTPDDTTSDPVNGTVGDRAPAVFDPTTLDGLPAPARRLLARSLPRGTSLSEIVHVDMRGEIKLGWWMPFTATQILHAGVGFVWNASAGGWLLRFVGADALGPDLARMEFRLHGRIPVVRADGDDVRRSARGRLAAETVAWLPQALTPQAGARWQGIDDERATVTVEADGTHVDVDVAVDADGRLRWLSLQRWNSSADPPAFAAFGGAVDESYTTATGVRVAGAGSVGWGWHPDAPGDGVFFRYRVVGAGFGTAGSSRTEAP